MLVLRTLWMFVKFLKFVAENPRIPFYPFIFLYHENMEFRVFCGIFNEIFKKFQILFFPFMKLQLLINNVFIIFDNCAFKIQNSKKPRFWTVSYAGLKSAINYILGVKNCSQYDFSYQNNFGQQKIP